MSGIVRALGRRFRTWRAGIEWRVVEDVRFASAPRTIVLRSDAFANCAAMPAMPQSPPLAWSGVPAGTKTIVLIAEDVDVPMPRPFTHAVAYGIDPGATSLPPGALNADSSGAHDAEPSGAHDAESSGGPRVEHGYNGAGKRSYAAPAPIPGHGPHRYFFTLLAVDYEPRFDQPPTRGRLLDAIAGHVLATGELMGTLER